jgi:spore germination protein GerM
VTRRPFILLTALGVVLAGCAIPRDDEPRQIPGEQQALLAEAGSPGQIDTEALGPRVYFLRDGGEAGSTEAVPVSRSVSSTADAVMRSLFAGLTEEESDAGLRTSIPSGTELISARQIAARTLQVDVTEQIFEAGGEAQIEAVAQIVSTAGGLPGVDRVRLLVEGEPRDWLAGDGSLVSGPLTPFMYPSFAGTSRPAFPPIPSPTVPTTTEPAQG